MRFRIPRSILRAAIAANLFVAASAPCYPSIPGNRNNSYQPIGLMDVAEAGGLMTFGRIDKLPNFVLYSPVSTASEYTDAVISKADIGVETIPVDHRMDGGCEIDQDFSGCWMTCPEETGQFASAIEDQKQIGYIDQQQIAAWINSGVDALDYSISTVRDYAIEAPFDSGEALTKFFALSKDQISSPTIGIDSGNIFVYVIEHVDDSVEEMDPNNTINTDSDEPAIVTVNPFQSGVQDLIAEIESSITSKSLGCGFDPYETCFPNEIAESVAVNDIGNVGNTRLVSEDEFIPFHIKLLSGQFDMAMAESDPAGVGHCAIPVGIESGVDIKSGSDILTATLPADTNFIEEAISSDHVVETVVVDQTATIAEDQWRPRLDAARSMIESWIEPNWDIRKWDFATRSSSILTGKKVADGFRASKFRWDDVYGRIDSPMLSEIPIDPSLTLAYDLYPQPRWYVSSDSSVPDESPEEVEVMSEEGLSPPVDVVAEEPKKNSDQLVALAQKAWGYIGQAIYEQYTDSARIWQRVAFDSKRLVATQMKKIGGLILRSADSLEGNIGIAKRDGHPNDGNR